MSTALICRLWCCRVNRLDGRRSKIISCVGHCTGAEIAKKTILVFALLVAAMPCRARTISVDDDGPSDFDTIQAAVLNADPGDTVIIEPGIYKGPGNRDIDFYGKAITVRSTNPLDAVTVSKTVIDCQGTPTDYHRAFVFRNQEDERSVIAGLTLTGGYADDGGAIACRPYCSPVIRNCIIRSNTAEGNGGGIWGITNKTKVFGCLIEGNVAGIYGGGVRCCEDSDFTISNCVIRSNSSGDDGGGFECCRSNATVTGCLFEGNISDKEGGGIWYVYTVAIDRCTIVGNQAALVGGGAFLSSSTGKGIITNSIVRDNLPEDIRTYSVDTKISYCNSELVATPPPVEVGWVNVDPSFVRPGQWVQDPCDASNLIWAGGDYHLKSQAGRWEAIAQTWINDDTTSPCIDAGNPISPVGLEPFPNGGIVNMGVYGGTTEASKSYFECAPCESVIAGDVNGDCIVDYRDLTIVARHWREDSRVRAVTQTVLIPEQAKAKALIPANDSLGLDWTHVEFDDSGWLSGETAVGFHDFYGALVKLDVSAARDVSTSVYVRISFDVADPSRFDGLVLHMKYEDGFAAYLNGRLVASANAPEKLAFNSSATDYRTTEVATLGFQEFHLGDHIDVLGVGRNVLAIHGLHMNVSRGDLLVLPKLIGETTEGPCMAAVKEDMIQMERDDAVAAKGVGK